MDSDKIFDQEIYQKTSTSMEDVVKSLPTYAEIMQSFNAGEAEVELRKRFMLKKLDETWISAIEDCLPSLDTIIRNPQFRLMEKEEVLPVEISKHINGRSVVHLSQHTDMINEIKDDGSVIPSHLLNVFQEDTVLTYENKFINTLVNRLFAFIAIRFNGAQECGEDEKNTTLTMDQNFEHREYKGKIHVSIEISQKPEEHEVIKNYIYTSDLWKRMEKLYKVVNEYMSTPFVINMGRNFIHPPVMRTNTILKNPLFKDCLSLWEFIESYENTGYETLVQEDLITVPEELLKDMYNSISEQYVVFQTHIKNGFDEEKALDSRLLNVSPHIKDEFDEPNDDEFDYKTLIPDILKNEPPLEYPEKDIEYAILVALAADAMMYQEETEEEETVIDEKGEIKFRYKYSFLARLIRAQLPTQDYYNEIKNELLSYKGVKSFISWTRELFKQGRKQCCKLNCKGKTLFVYLPLDPNEFDVNKYHHFDVTKENGKNEYPFLLKVRSKRACKYAKELIGIVMDRLGILKDEAYVPQDFHMAPMTIDELLDKDLARLIGEYGERKHKQPEPVVVPLPDSGFEYKYIYSFTAKVIRSGEERQEFYNQIKNELLSYSPVKSKISWPRELFRNGRDKVAQLKVKGKTLCLYLPLDPDRFDYNHYHHEDIRVEGKDNEFSLMLRIKSNRAVKYAKELIAVLMGEIDLVKTENYEDVDYKFPYKDIDQLLAEDLARLVNGERVTKPIEKPVPVVSEDEDSIAFKYKFSYSARLIRSGEERQDLYNAMKNEVLSYKKVNSKISWGHELFKFGRNKISLFKVKGKTLCVYLPLNPENYDQEHYYFVDLREEGKDVEFPLMMKIKSMRAVKYTAELLKDVMANLGLDKDETYKEVDYKLPYMSIEEMLVSDPVLAKLIEGEPVKVERKVEEIPAEPASITAPIVATEEDVDSIAYKYKFSYSARLIRSGDDRQYLYNLAKNEVLSYKKINNKISWGHELFKLGRIKVSLFKVKGKTLCIYLPLNPDDFDMEHYHFKDLREEGKDVEFPMMLKITSERAVKYYAELLSYVMANNEIVKNGAYEEQDYKLPNMTIEEMLSADPALAKLIDNAEIPVFADPKVEEIPAKPAPIVTPVVAPEEEEEVITYKYKFSYSARLVMSGEEKQEFYNEMKNEILSYKKVNNKISWGHEIFKLGRNKLAQFKVKGKTLYVYLPLNPDDYEESRFHHKDLRVKGKEIEFPMMMKVKSPRAVNYVKELIGDVMAKSEIVKNEDYVAVDYKLGEMSIEEMLNAEPPLIKELDGESNVSFGNDNKVVEETYEEPKVEENHEIVEENAENLELTEQENSVEEVSEENKESEIEEPIVVTDEQNDSKAEENHVEDKKPGLFSRFFSRFRRK